MDNGRARPQDLRAQVKDDRAAIAPPPVSHDVDGVA